MVERGNVLYLAGENPDDVRMRWIAQCGKHKLDANVVDVAFMEGACSIPENIHRIEGHARERGGLTLVIVDTSAAYSESEDEIDNAKQHAHAEMLRGLTRLTGKPCVVAACHPPKAAKAKEDMVPRGGGSFVAAVDGNLCLYDAEGTTEMHWTRKFRGPDFRPLHFTMETIIDCEKLVTASGSMIATVLARPLTFDEVKDKANVSMADQQTLLRVMLAHDGSSVADLASHAGWLSADGKPQKSKVYRLLTQKLSPHKLVQRELKDRWVLTAAGKKAASR